MNKITIDETKCINCGACTVVSPDNFKLMDGRLIVTNDEIDDDSAANGCPVGAITLS